MADFAIGIDIGGTNTKFGIVDQKGHILQQERLLTNEPEVERYYSFCQNGIRKIWIESKTYYRDHKGLMYADNISQLTLDRRNDGSA